jgi:hypothetical protein
MSTKFHILLFVVLTAVSDALPVTNLTSSQFLQESMDKGCCYFHSGMKDVIGGATFDTSGGIKKSATMGWEFEHSTPAIGVSASSGKAFIDCDPGSKIKKALGVCGMLPINDKSKWNAVGFELPSLELHFFGITFDVAGALLDKAMDSLPSSWSSDQKAAAESASKKDMGGDGGDGGDDKGGLQNDEVMGAGACIAFQKHTCGMGFAMAQSGLLKAVCAIAGQALYCGPDLPASGPKVELMLLAVGFSPMRDLQFSSSLGIWNGVDSLGDALEKKQFTTKGVIGMTGLIGMDAFEFPIGVTNVQVGMEMVGSIMIDVKLPDPRNGISKIKELFKTLVGGKFKQLLGAGLNTAEAVIPPFQVLIEGSQSFVAELAPNFEFEFTVGEAAMTMGFNMEADYPGYSNGIYISARRKLCLADIIPPLKNSMFKCNGKAIFDKTCATAQAGVYMSFKRGIGFQTELEASLIGGNKMKWAVGMKVGTDTKGSVEMKGSLKATLGGSSVSLDAAVGFTFGLKNPSFKPFFRAKFPNPLEVLKALGLLVPKATERLVKILRGWIGIEEQLQLKKTSSRKLLQDEPVDISDSTAFAQTDSTVGGRRRRRRWGGRRRRWHAHVPHVHLPHRHHTHVPHRHHIHVPHVHVPHRHHIHVPHLHIPNPFEDTSLVLKFSDVSASADICRFRMRFKITVGAKIFGVGKRTSAWVNMDYRAGELGDVVIDEVVKTFSSVKKLFV